MALSMAHLLIHSDSVPTGARNALREAIQASPENQGALLESAARILYTATDLECGDARELVGLSEGCCG
jgi:hypothetical protein